MSDAQHKSLSNHFSDLEIALEDHKLASTIPNTIIASNPFTQHQNIQNTDSFERKVTICLSISALIIDENLKALKKLANLTGEEKTDVKRATQIMAMSIRPEAPKIDAPRSKKVLVLDLDETIIHTYNIHINKEQDKGIAFSPNYKCLIRPHLNRFLEELSSCYHIVVFSSGDAIYVRKIIKLIDKDRCFIKRVITCNDCTKIKKGEYLKDLSIFNVPLTSIVIVDNKLVSFANNIENGIWVKSYYGEDDNELESVMSFLLANKDVSDIRIPLKTEYYLQTLLTHSSKLN